MNYQDDLSTIRRKGPLWLAMVQAGVQKPLSQFCNEFGGIRTTAISNFMVLSATAPYRAK